MPTPIPANIPSVGPKTLSLLRHHGVHTNMDVVLAGEEGHSRISGLGPTKWSLVWGWAWDSLSAQDRLTIAEAIAGMNIDEEFEAYVESIAPDDSRHGWKEIYNGDAGVSGVRGMDYAHTVLLESMQEDAETHLEDLTERLTHAVDADTELKIRQFLDERRKRLANAVRSQREHQERRDKEDEARNRAGCLKMAGAATIVLGVIGFLVKTFFLS